MAISRVYIWRLKATVKCPTFVYQSPFSLAVKSYISMVRSSSMHRSFFNNKNELKITGDFSLIPCGQKEPVSHMCKRPFHRIFIFVASQLYYSTF